MRLILWILLFQTAWAASTPIPRPGSESLKGRAERELALKVAGDSAGVEFEVDTSKLLGSITTINLSSGYFKYLPPKDRSVSADSFRFRAKRSGTYSPWEVFKITVSDIGPKIEVPSYLDFGKVRMGEVRELPLELSNTGDTPSEIIVETNRSWFTASPTQFLLEPSGKKTLNIRFAPSVSGRALADLTVTSSGSVQLVRLAGDIPSWLEVRPGTLTLSPSKNHSREAVLMLTNPNPEDETVTVDSKSALVHQSIIQVPAGESVEVRVSVPSIQKQALKGLLSISNSRDFLVSVPWSAKVVPASLTAETQISPDLTILPSLIRMQNSGGLGGTWKLSIPPPFFIENEQSLAVSLQPNESREIRVSRSPVRKLDAAAARTVTAGSVRISGPDKEVEIRIENLAPQKNTSIKPVIPPLPKAAPKPMPAPVQDPDFQSFALPLPQAQNDLTPSPSPAPQTNPTSGPQKTPSSETTPHFDSTIDPAIRNSILEQSAIPLLSGVRIENVTPTSAAILVPYPPTTPKNYPLIMHRRVRVKSGSDASFEWSLLKFEPPKRINAEVLLYEISGLDPGESNAIRIVSPQLIDKTRVVMQQFNIETPPEKTRISWRLVLALLTLLAACGVYAQRRN